MPKEIFTTGVERRLDAHKLIVSKTDLKGRITYVNDVFTELSGYVEKECLGQPHSMIRHPAMPRCIFSLLWGAIQNGQEIFAYVVNRCKNGDHYWVLAHVTPSTNQTGKVIGYHSNRRAPDHSIIERKIIPLYQELVAQEQQFQDRKEGLSASLNMVSNMLADANLQYDEFIARL